MAHPTPLSQSSPTLIHVIICIRHRHRGIVRFNHAAECRYVFCAKGVLIDQFSQDANTHFSRLDGYDGSLRQRRFWVGGEVVRHGRARCQTSLSGLVQRRCGTFPFLRGGGNVYRRSGHRMDQPANGYNGSWRPPRIREHELASYCIRLNWIVRGTRYSYPRSLLKMRGLLHLGQLPLHNLKLLIPGGGIRPRCLAHLTQLARKNRQLPYSSESVDSRSNGNGYGGATGPYIQSRWLLCRPFGWLLLFLGFCRICVKCWRAVT